MIKKTLVKTLQNTKRYHGFLAATVIGSLLVVLFMTTSYANNQNMMRHKLTRDIQALEDEYRLLNTQATQLQTAQRIEMESQRLNLVKVQASDIHYLEDAGKTVALRD